MAPRRSTRACCADAVSTPACRESRASQCSEASLSVCTWNLLAPSTHETHPGSLDWESIRLPALRHWLGQLALTNDILCFQEVDVHRFASELNSFLLARGFVGVLQERKKGFPVVNATFFRANRLRLTWAVHRSSALILGFRSSEGLTLNIANVHLKAGASMAEAAQREAQLTSILSWLGAKPSSASVVCGDFNSNLAGDDPLHEALVRGGLRRARSAGGPTIAVSGYTDVLDHIWCSNCLRPSAEVLGVITAAGLPDIEHPSDHLPVVGTLDIRTRPPKAVAEASLLPLMPATDDGDGFVPDENVWQTWLAILWQAGPGTTNSTSRSIRRAAAAAVREQREFEDAFLATLGLREATLLRNWRDWAHNTAATTVANVVERACANISLPEQCRPHMY
eukprot:gnl/TRDRNA2_/TRDRNA2_75098_c0_seq2.p1 gnl/TRDRNA2_/TRDRNA2_75098_c0~~gnl/TRDRNA2_/TRDRNA2_75098_c0_seq2.p1  ORF type:complete len:419 (+),score=40.51 gnl/TRDRNA2_/TRDRNA2_75098_c0_seq2:72-1259(+)